MRIGRETALRAVDSALIVFVLFVKNEPTIPTTRLRIVRGRRGGGTQCEERGRRRGIGGPEPAARMEGKK